MDKLTKKLMVKIIKWWNEEEIFKNKGPLDHKAKF